MSCMTETKTNLEHSHSWRGTRVRIIRDYNMQEYISPLTSNIFQSLCWQHSEWSYWYNKETNMEYLSIFLIDKKKKKNWYYFSLINVEHISTTKGSETTRERQKISETQSHMLIYKKENDVLKKVIVNLISSLNNSSEVGWILGA